jgi:hypothetical protein
MERISLRKALQKKNLKAGRIKTLQNLIATKNSYKEGTPDGSREDVKALMIELTNERNGLIALKTAVTKANVGIYPVLCELDELKSFMSFLDTIQTLEGAQQQHVRMGQDPIVTQQVAQYSEKDVRNIKAETQKKLEELQEKVDEFNSVTYIEV